MTANPTLDQEGLEAASDRLYAIRLHHHWWRAPSSLPASWRNFDPIGQSEFVGIVEEVISAYLQRTAG
jgi:hypothetical protein